MNWEFCSATRYIQKVRSFDYNGKIDTIINYM